MAFRNPENPFLPRGTATITIAAGGSSGSASVTFPEDTFSSPPLVFFDIQSGSAGGSGARLTLSSKSVTGATFVAYHVDLGGTFPSGVTLIVGWYTLEAP